MGTGVLAEHSPERCTERDILGAGGIKEFGERGMSLGRDLGQA